MGEHTDFMYIIYYIYPILFASVLFPQKKNGKFIYYYVMSFHILVGHYYEVLLFEID